MIFTYDGVSKDYMVHTKLIVGIAITVIASSCNNKEEIFRAIRINKSGKTQIIVYDNDEFRKTLNNQVVFEGRARLKGDTLSLYSVPDFNITMVRTASYIIKGKNLCESHKVYLMDTSTSEVEIKTLTEEEPIDSCFNIIKAFK